MNIMTKISLIHYTLEEIFKYFVLIEGDKLIIKNVVSPLFVYCMEEIFERSLEVVYRDVDEICSFCNSKLNKNGTQKFLLNKNKEIRKQKYVCSNKKCVKYFTTGLWGFISKGCNYMNFFMLYPVEQSFIAYKPLSLLSEELNLRFQTRIRRQTIYYYYRRYARKYLDDGWEKIYSDLEKAGIEPSGIYHYDEQFLKIRTDQFARLTLLDAQNRMIWAEKLILSQKLKPKNIKKFIEETFRGKPLIALITDDDNMYPGICSELDVLQQLCSFHKMKNLMDEINKKFNRNKRKIKYREEKLIKIQSQIKEINKKTKNKIGRIKKEDIAHQKINQQRKKLKRESSQFKQELRELKDYNKQLTHYKDKISLMFHSKTLKTFYNRYQWLLDHIKELPEEIVSYLNKLSKKIDKLTTHLKHDNIPSTNNALENFYGVTLKESDKKKYKTTEGAELRIEFEEQQYIKRNVLNKKQEKQKIPVI
jgi:hypothetical protein